MIKAGDHDAAKDRRGEVSEPDETRAAEPATDEKADAVPDEAKADPDRVEESRPTAAQSAPAQQKSEKAARRSRGRIEVGRTVRTIRTYLGRLVWLVCLLAALVLAVGALLIALGANQDNGLVKEVLKLADVADLGVFSRDNGIKQFSPPDAATKNALFNWGIGALCWLIGGRILDRIIRPR
ncbi:MAG: hypothetical protein QM638_05875 [Nocardioides sp.]|uniref:hypothetical protein n=1 Tax=Nocardioides sp. TaxID=35761 RepID=UPI0039E62363